MQKNRFIMQKKLLYYAEKPFLIRNLYNLNCKEIIEADF
jgi:hypothetical protein